MALAAALVKLTTPVDFPLSHAQQHFYDKADHHLPALLRYARDNHIDLRALHQLAIVLGIFQVVFDGAGFFHFAAEKEAGTAAIVTEVKADDDETIVDLVAWDMSKPELFGSYDGMPVLGLTNTTNPATWVLGGALLVHRTPLAWAQANGKGVVILHHEYAYRYFDANYGPLMCEDEDHAKEVIRILSPPPFPGELILYRESQS
jgi:hypothetical protein